MSESISEQTRASIRDTAAQMAQYRQIPAAEFPGHKGIALANLEGYLGRFTLPLLDALEDAEAAANSACVSGENPNKEAKSS